MQYATRAQGRVPNAQSGTGPAINITGVANFGGPIAAVADAGFGFTQNVLQVNNSTTLLKGNHALKSGFDLQWVDGHARRRRRPCSTRSRTRPRTWRRAAARTASATPPSRSTSACRTSNTTPSQYGFFVQDDWRVSLGPEGALRPALRPLRAARRAIANAPVATSREFPQSKNNFAPRARRGVDARREQAHRAPRQHRPDVRPDAERDLRAGAAERRHQRARVGHVHADPGRRAGVPGGAQHGLGRDAEPRVDGRSRLRRSRGRGRTTCSSSAASAITTRSSIGTLVREGLQPAGRHQHQPDQPDRHAGRRPPDLQHGRQRDDARRSALQRHQQRAVARRVRPTRT